MTDTFLVLGCDNSMKATGLVLIEYRPHAGPQRALWWDCIFPNYYPSLLGKTYVRDPLDMVRRLKASLSDLGTILRPQVPDLLTTEEGFAVGGRKSRAGIEVAQAGGIVMGIVCYLFDCNVISLQASPIGKRKGWRERVLRSNPNDKTQCVAECTRLAAAAGIPEPMSEHVAEAFGIASAGGAVWTNLAVKAEGFEE